MIEEKYSAGLISQSFWFIEMKKIIKLIDEGKSEEEIKNLCISENLFGAAKEQKGFMDIFGTEQKSWTKL